MNALKTCGFSKIYLESLVAGSATVARLYQDNNIREHTMRSYFEVLTANITQNPDRKHEKAQLEAIPDLLVAARKHRMEVLPIAMGEGLRTAEEHKALEQYHIPLAQYVTDEMSRTYRFDKQSLDQKRQFYREKQSEFNFHNPDLAQNVQHVSRSAQNRLETIAEEIFEELRTKSMSQTDRENYVKEGTKYIEKIKGTMEYNQLLLAGFPSALQIGLELKTYEQAQLQQLLDRFKQDPEIAQRLIDNTESEASTLSKIISTMLLVPYDKPDKGVIVYGGLHFLRQTGDIDNTGTLKDNMITLNPTANLKEFNKDLIHNSEYLGLELTDTPDITIDLSNGKWIEKNGAQNNIDIPKDLEVTTYDLEADSSAQPSKQSHNTLLKP